MRVRFPARRDWTRVGTSPQEGVLMVRSFTALVLLLAVGSGAPGLAQSLVDAGFEAPAQGAGKWMYRPTVSTWSFTGSSGLAGNGSGFTAQNPPAPQGAQ